MNVLLFLYHFGMGIQIAAEMLLKSTWEIHLVRRVVDTHITMEVLEARTLAHCSLSCSDMMGVEAKSLYFVGETNTCYCNKDIDRDPGDDSADKIVYGILRTLYKKEETEMQTIKYTVWPHPPDCLTLHEANLKEDGVYRIDPIGGAVTDTWCDMTNGGWTVIQRRQDGSEDFYRGWTDYVNGFGNMTGEYWLGLENIHHLTKAGSRLEIFLEAFPGVTMPSMTAHYSHFVVGNGSTEYTLHVSGFTGDCGDSFTTHSGYRFSTFDNDNDVATVNCALKYRGGWWHNACHRFSPNGFYFQFGEYSIKPKNFEKGIHWVTCWNRTQSMKSSVMKVRAT